MASKKDNKVGPKDSGAKPIKTVVVDMKLEDESYLATNTNATSPTLGRKGGDKGGEKDVSVEAQTNWNLYRGISRSDRKLYHFTEELKVVRNGEFLKINFHKISSFLSVASISRAVKTCNEIISASNNLARQFTFKGDVAHKELALLYNPLRVQDPTKIVYELKLIYSSLTVADELFTQLQKDYESIVSAGHVLCLSEAVEALSVLRQAQKSIQLYDTDVRKKLLEKVSHGTAALASIISAQASPRLLEAQYDLKTFESALKHGDAASWVFMNSLCSLLDSDNAKAKAAAIEVVTAVNTTLADVVYPLAESSALAAHALSKAFPKNGIYYFWKYHTNIVDAVRFLSFIVQAYGAALVLLYFVLNYKQVIPF